MKQVAKWLKSQLSRIDGSEDSGEDYVALESRKYENKLKVRTFALTEFEDVKKISKCVREGQSVVLVDLKPLKEKDGGLFQLLSTLLYPCILLTPSA